MPVQTFTGFRTDPQFAFGDCSVGNDLNFALYFTLAFGKVNRHSAQYGQCFLAIFHGIPHFRRAARRFIPFRRPARTQKKQKRETRFS
jgi:hypothetical protein